MWWSSDKYLNVDIKYTPSEAAILSVISKHDLRKVKVYCVASIKQTKSVVGQREGRKACIRVQLLVQSGNNRGVLNGVGVSVDTVIQEVTSAAESPVGPTLEEIRSPTQICIIVIARSFIVRFLSSSTVYA